MKIRLSTKFGLGIFLVSGIGVFLFAYLSYSQISGYFKQNLLYHLSVELDSDANDIQNALKFIKNDVKNLAISEEVKGYMRAYKNPYHYDAEENINLEDWKDRLEDKFKTYIEQHESYFQIRLIGVDNDGLELLRCDRINDKIVFTKGKALQKKGRRAYFKDTVSLKKNDIYISKINLNKEHGNIYFPLVPTVRIATPLYFEGKIFGIVIINSNTDKLFKLEKYKDIKGKSTYLVDSKGYYLFHNDIDKTFAFEFKRKHNIKDDFSVDSILETNNEKLGYYEGDEIAFFAKKIWLKDDFIILARSATNIFLQEQSDEYTKKMFFYIVLVTLMIAVFSAVLTRILTKPILKLTNRAKIVAESSGEKEISFKDIKSHDEIGELSSSMEVMVEKLISSKKELSSFAQSLEKEVQKRTNEQETLLSLFDKGDAVLFKWVNDDNWSTNSVSRSVDKLLGFSEKEFLNEDVKFLSCIKDKDLQNVLDEVRHAIEDGKSYFEHKPYRVITKDNKVKWIHQNTIFVKDEQGDDISYFLGYLIDITELKELNDKLEQKVALGIEQIRSKDELLAQQSKLAAMGEMIGAIAHQWRQPLNTLAVEVQFMEDDYEDGLIDKEYIKEYKEENMKLINFMSKTIDDFRNFFRVDKEKVVFDIKEKIEDTTNILSSQLKSHDIDISLVGDGFETLGFASEFQQVVLNIINNAKDAIIENGIKDGKISILIKVSNKVGTIRISDNAGGIPEDILTRVFDPYFTTKDQGKGTGLGLYMSKMIIEENMNGSLNVANDTNGAVFTIELKIN